MVVIGKVTDAKTFSSFLKELNVHEKIFVVKPNWSNAHTYTSAETLNWLFSALKSNIKVIEGYSAWRNELNVGPQPTETITPTNAKAKWPWIKEQDKWFLQHTGIAQVLADHGVTYINVTEECWSTRTMDPDEVREFVDSKYGVIVNREMYRYVPTKIHQLRDSALISMNLSRDGHEPVSLATNNLIGLIPDPARFRKWQSKSERHLSQSIIDINKIYRSFFSPCYWINQIPKQSLLVGSRNSVEADAVTATLLGYDPGEIGYLRHAATVFGGYDEKVLTQIPKSF
jgi:hypothetical protein